MRKIILASIFLLGATPAFATPQNPQRIAGGSFFPVYVNATGTSQSNAHGIYVDQTQYTPVVVTSAQTLTLTGVGN